MSTDTMYKLSQIASFFPRGTVAEHQVKYWAAHGLRGHKLPVLRAGRNKFVTDADLRAFLVATNQGWMLERLPAVASA